LVLPGIGHFVLADDKLVESSDLGQNFFITEDDIGSPRAEAVSRWLLELNSDASGEAAVISVAGLLAKEAEYFKSFDLVIATQVSETQALQLASLLPATAKLIVVRSLGFIGYMRIYAKELLVVESKPADKEIKDLRLNAPFPKLVEYVNSVDVAALDDMLHGHVPFVVLLLKTLDQWKAAHDGALPKNFAEKDEFKRMIKAGSRSAIEDNYAEAVANAYICFSSEVLPYESQQVLDDPQAQEANATSDLFWQCARAVSDFSKAHGIVPVTGSFPDMTADTESYLTLQRM
jgi:amyloid beta precursor protein binding protein 1